MKHIWKVFTAILFLALLLAGCGTVNNAKPNIGSITEDRLEKTSAGEANFFQIPVDQAMLNAGRPISIQTSGKTTSGNLRVVLRDPDGQVVWDPGTFGGEYQANTYVKPTKVGTYQLGIAWDGPVSGQYKLSYQAEGLTPTALLGGLGMILVAVAFIVYALRRGGTWGYLGLGALAWTVTVVVKFIIAIPLNPLIYKALWGSTVWSPGSLLFDVYVGSLTGWTEVLMTWLLLRYTRLGRVTWNKVLAFGVGFGAFEALLLGVSSLSTALTAMFVPQALPASAVSSLLMLNNPLYGLAPVVERIATIFLHIACNALLFYGVARGQSRWMWVSFALKTLADTVGAFAQMWGVGTIGRLWTIEAIIIVFGILSGWAIWRIAQAYPERKPEPPAPVLAPQEG